MFEQIAAFDIGTTSIKLVRLKKTLRDFQVLSFASEEISAEEEHHEDAIRDALVRLIENNPIKGHIVVSNLPMERSILRVIKFPFADIEKIAEAIPFEAQENIPFNIDDLVMDFQMLPGADPEEGRILLAASHHEAVHDYIRTFDEQDLQVHHLGLEANALFETYRHFNKVGDENIIQLDFGHNKTIINIISNNTLVYTRCIYIGTGLIIRNISEVLGINYIEASSIYERLNLDLTSFENNVHRHFYKTLEIPKPKLKLIFNHAHDIAHDLSEQIMLTLKSFFVDYGSIEFSRVMLSGGGSNLIGIGSIFSEHISAPIVALPFLDEYQDEHIKAVFPVAFGTALSYINGRRTINFMKGEFSITGISLNFRKYHLAALFVSLAVIVFVINIIFTLIFSFRISTSYDSILNAQFKRYFHTEPKTDNPIEEAEKFLADEKKRMQELSAIIPAENSPLASLATVTSFFPDAPGFNLKNMTIEENIIRLDGDIDSVQPLDSFKNALLESKQFDSVDLNTNIIGSTSVRFSMVIKLKSTTTPAVKK